MYNKLKFKAYASRNLNNIAVRFEEQIGREPGVFVIRSAWKDEVFGSPANMEKVFISRFGAFACVMVPLYLTLDELRTLDAIRKTNGSIPTQAVDKDEQLEKRLKAYTRYCNYCGRIYGTDPLNVVSHCGAPACIQKHEEWEEQKKLARRLRAQSKRNSYASRPENDDEEEIEDQDVQEVEFEAPDFNLYDPDNPTDQGWIYLIEAENGLYKIGRSDNVGQRFGELVNQSPVQLRLTHTVYAEDYKKSEVWLHGQFKNRRHHGEWFQLSEDEVEWVCGLVDNALDRV